MLVRMWRDWGPQALPVGVSNGAATEENSVGAPQKIKRDSPYSLAVPLLGLYPKGPEAGSPTDARTPVFTATYSQRPEGRATRGPAHR